MEVGNDLGKLRHGSQGQTPLLRHAVQELRLVESAHDQHPLDDFALTGNVKSAAVIESYRKDFKINMRRCAAIEAKLVEERAPPQLQGREVEERVFYGTLDLVSARARQEHDGGMGLDSLNFAVHRRIGVRRGHEIEHRRLVGFGLLHGPNIAQGRGASATEPRKPLETEPESLLPQARLSTFPQGEALPREQEADGAEGCVGGPDWQPRVAVAVTFCVSGTPPAFAAPDSTAASRDQIEARRQALLQSMLQDPSNLDVAFEYASLSSQVGDYEAAVSTLERMLIFAPNTPRLQLELGILYYRLGSYEVSRSYFAQVVANPNVPPEIAAKVRLYLQQLAIEAEPPPFSAHDLQRHSLGEQCELSPGLAGRHPERHRLHPR